MRYFFAFGNHPQLSLTELLSVTPQTKALIFSGSSALIEYPQELELPALQERLGGTIKIGTIAFVCSRASIEHEQIMSQIIDSLPHRVKKRFSFGLSFYDLGNADLFHRLSQKQEKIGLTLKKLLKGRGTPARYVTGKNRAFDRFCNALSSVSVAKNGLLGDAGKEYLFLCAPKELLIAETKTVQPFEDFSERDYGRPHRDAKSGMLPPKVARIMINLSGMEPAKSTLLDPFCGSGTILQEALLMGYKKVIGSDISAQAITSCRRNLEWLKQKYRTSDTLRHFDYQLHICDAARLETKIQPSSIDVIVTKPFLGPPLKGKESNNELSNIAKRLSQIYNKALKSFEKVLTEHGRVVMILPHFVSQTHDVVPKLSLEVLGLKQIFPFASAIRNRDPLIYYRPGQKLRREIIILERYKRSMDITP